MSPRRIGAAVALSVLAATSAAAQAAASPGALASANGGFIALSVADLEATAAWYADKLSLHRVMTVPRTGRIAGVVALEGDGILVELIQHDDAKPGTAVAELTHGIAKAGVIVANFDEVVSRLRARGVTFFSGPYPARANQRANVSFKDNAGNLIQVLGPR